ncbi:MAG TPA: hypothetical protein VJQ79_05955 [Acidimicrobiia bacterium]|nr:hypothetical protein [Acidimicrobiia bacterium]
MLCTQADVEKRLQWDITAEPDAVVTALIAAAQATIEAEVGRALESDDYTEVFDGGRPAIFLTHWPVTAITTVEEDGTALTVTTEYVWYANGKVIRVSGGYQRLWKTWKIQAIEVDYTGGYLAGTHDSELAHLGSICAEVVARAFRLGAANAATPAGVTVGGVQSVTVEGQGSITYATAGGETMTLDGGGLSQFVYLVDNEREQLQVYKRFGMGFA